MSCIAVDGGPADVCANCGSKLGSDAVKLKNCTACCLVKYCGVDCQRAHRKQHKKACKQRAAELKDEQLYSQGLERPEGDFCPICTLPIPLQVNEHSGFMVCCMKRICFGCSMAAQKRGMFDCAFCRTPVSDDDDLTRIQARVSKNDPVAIHYLGQKYFWRSWRSTALSLSVGFCRTPFWREFRASNADPDTTPERKLSQVAESRSRKGSDSSIPGVLSE
ncbi:hypothetical protein THAOC_22196 [Thalassiosira oceanica]|uniref:MYND-type domain-containing protein n=1 Tax=Thalassiosira oceanica TaxID=159749 RepID=K0S9Z0_THAOC|nr:hypothetical protein THAOC_22196 [Thalassiosira oceanica]|eukprot:EJK57731.1 hypothetical protein THAOC_22196 [Thalassiosira oceanica]